jgi:glycerophosphoryl diester phosphodiesterase
VVERTFTGVPVLCGHRGCGAGVVDGHRENTLASFQAAVDAGLDWVEVDARVTADRVLVASHDPVVADGRFIAELSAAETDALGLLRIADLLEALAPGVGVDVDVKTSLEDALRPRAETTAALAADLLAPAGEIRRLLVTSFDPAALLIVRERAPELAVGLITWTRFPLRKAIPAAVHLGADVVVAHVASFGFAPRDAPTFGRSASRTVQVAHEAGLQVAAWCPLASEMEDCVAAGIDCLIVDAVPAAVRAAPVR